MQISGGDAAQSVPHSTPASSDLNNDEVRRRAEERRQRLLRTANERQQKIILRGKPPPPTGTVPLTPPTPFPDEDTLGASLLRPFLPSVRTLVLRAVLMASLSFIYCLMRLHCYPRCFSFWMCPVWFYMTELALRLSRILIHAVCRLYAFC